MSQIKKVSTAVAICMGLSCFHVVNAWIEVTINPNLNTATTGESMLIGQTAQSESGNYIPSTNWDEVPPAGANISEGGPYIYTLHNQSGISAHTLVAEIGLNFYGGGGTSPNDFLGTCYLVASNADANLDNGSVDFTLNLVGAPVGYEDSQNHYVPTVQEYGPSQLNSCPYAKTFNVTNNGGGGQPEISFTINPVISSFVQKPQMQTTLITNKDINGKPLYRVDIQSGVLSSASALTQFTFSSYWISYAPSYSFLPPIKILSVSNSSGNYEYQLSNSDFYIEAPDVPDHPTINVAEGLNNASNGWGNAATLSTTDPTAGLNAKDFAINLIAPYGTNQTQDQVDSNGMDQVPLRVLICYAPGGMNPANCVLGYNGGASGVNDHGPITPSYIISPDYHPELMYLYKLVYFADLEQPTGQQLINNLQAPSSSGPGSSVTTIENYPGPYARNSSGDGIASNSYQGVDVQSSNAFNNNPSWYFLSTTQTTQMEIQPNLIINGVAVQSDIADNQGIVIKGESTSNPTATFLSGHVMKLPIFPYNANLFDAENSAATYFDPKGDVIRGIGKYSVVQGNDYSSLSAGGTIAPYYSNSIVFVNSDGSLTLPDNYEHDQYTASANPSFMAVDVLGDTVQVK